MSPFQVDILPIIIILFFLPGKVGKMPANMSIFYAGGIYR